MFENLIVKKSPEKKELPNVVEMETDNAQYRIYYDNHERGIDQRLLDDCDGLIMEMMADYSDPEKAKEMFGKICANKDGSMGLLQIAAKNKKPIYFVDMHEKNSVQKDLSDIETKSVVEFLAGLGIGSYVLKKVIENKKMNRRNFLKLGLGTVAATYLSTPMFQGIVSEETVRNDSELPDENSVSRKAEKVLGNINRIIHPEMKTMTLETRNDLMAQKSETVAKNLSQKIRKKPKLALIVGARHFGIEQSLKDTEQARVKRLKKDLGEDLPKNSAIARINFIQGDKEIYYDATVLKDSALE